MDQSAQGAGARALGARYTLTSLLGRGATGEVWLGAERRRGRRGRCPGARAGRQGGRRPPGGRGPNRAAV